jgi:hypothetical protein
VSGTGSLPVTGIDLAVANSSGLNTFYASIWTVSAGGDPGVQLANAYWSLSTSTSAGTCCGLVSVSGITGVTLIGGHEYFMVLGPLSGSDNSFNVWDWSNQVGSGTILVSANGGSTWTGDGPGLGAFDVTSNGSSTPEPTTWPLLIGLGGGGFWRFRKHPVA